MVRKIHPVLLDYYGNIIQKVLNRTYNNVPLVKNKLEKSLKKVLIVNSFSPNIGDLSIVSTMSNTIYEKMNNVEITILATAPEVTAVYVKNAKAMRSLSSRSDKALKQLLSFCLFLRNMLWLKMRKNGTRLPIIGKRTRDILEEYLSADIVVSCGGGYLNDNARSAFLGCLCDIYLGVALHKAVMLYGQSIGPFHRKRYRCVAKAVLEKVDIITLRDEASKICLVNMGVRKPRIEVTADAAFLQPTADISEIKGIMQDKCIIGSGGFVTITLKPWHFPGMDEPGKGKSNYIRAITNLCLHILQHYRRDVLFIPMDINMQKLEIAAKGCVKARIKDIARRTVKGILGSSSMETRIDEEILISEILKHIQSADRDGEERARVLEYCYMPGDIKAIIRESELHIATRMHSSIFAISQSIPTLAIAYEPKMTSFMEALGQGDYALNIEELESEDLIKRFDALWERRDEVREDISKRIEFFKGKSIMNATLLQEYIIRDQ